jgi:hypothetical protein
MCKCATAKPFQNNARFSDTPHKTLLHSSIVFAVLCCCSDDLIHAIGHLKDVARPVALLELLLSMRLPWPPEAVQAALPYLCKVLSSPECQSFSIYNITAAFLRAAGDYFKNHPASLLPALECACQLTAGPHKPAAAAAALLLAAYPGGGHPSDLFTAVTNTIEAQPPWHYHPAAILDFQQCQMKLLTLLLGRCPTPAAPGDSNDILYTSFIKVAVVAGAAPALELLLARTPYWQPHDLCEPDPHSTLVLFTWARETCSYAALFPIIARAAVARGATRQVLVALLQLAEPFKYGKNTQHRRYAQPVVKFVEAVAACNVSAEDLLPVLEKAARTCNIRLLVALKVSSPFRWPAAQLAPLLTQLAGGHAQHNVAAARMLLLVQEQQGFSTQDLAQAVAAAATAAAERALAAPELEAEGFTKFMCDPLVGACSAGYSAIAATAEDMGLLGAAGLLRRLYSTVGNGGETIRAPAAAAPAAMGVAAANAAGQHIGAVPGQQQQHAAPTAAVLGQLQPQHAAQAAAALRQLQQQQHAALAPAAAAAALRQLQQQQHAPRRWGQQHQQPHPLLAKLAATHCQQ